MNIHKLIIINLLLIISFSLSAQRKPAYNLFTSGGKKINYGKMVRQVKKGDMLLFGELHNNPIAHWLQLEMTRSLYSERNLILGAEMFEADNQEPLNRYLKGEINAKELASSARLWNNYNTDYAPIVNFARDTGLQLIATNIPRKYANMVYKNDFQALDTLSELEKSWIAPLPIEYDPELPGYKNMLTMMGHAMSETFPKSQAIKDATMAHFILKNYTDGNFFIHYHGSYHTDNYEGILWYLKQQRPDLKYFTIATVEQADVTRLEESNKDKADFILVVDKNMTKTF